MSYRPWHRVTVVPVEDRRNPKTNSEITVNHFRAINALEQGNATPEQQKEALHGLLWICGVDDEEYQPDEMGGERDSSFRSGKRFIGLQIRRVLNFPLDKLTGVTDGRSSRANSD